MQSQGKRDKLPVKAGFIACPICKRNKRLQFVPPDLEATGLPLYCRDCKNTIVVDIAKGQSVERRS